MMNKSKDYSLAYNTKSQLVLMRLRNAILNGELAPGEKIPQDRIAAEMSTSLIPVREALQKLEEQGFVTIVPHRGAVVNALNPQEIKEIYLIRIRIEGLAARAAARRIDGARLERLGNILKDSREALNHQETARLAFLNREFHAAAYDASGYSFLCHLIDDLRYKCERYRLLHSNISDRARFALQEHEMMLEAFARRDADAAEAATRINMVNSAKALLAAAGTESGNWVMELDEALSPFGIAQESVPS